MGVLQRFERRLGSVVEGIFARAFKSEVQPVEVAAALQRELDSRAAVGRDRTLVPNHFAVQLGDHDYDRLSPYEKALTKELAAMVREHASEQRYSFVGSVDIELRHVPSLETGVFHVQSDVVAGPEVGPIDLPGALPQALAGVAADGRDPRVVQAPQAAPQNLAGGYGHLVVREGRSARYEIELRQPVTVIGRGVDAGVRLTDHAVSRQHAEIRISDGRPTINDLGSTNGTLLNGGRINAAALSDGDEIQVGETRLIYRGPQG